jgi:hypothetical protein
MGTASSRAETAVFWVLGLAGFVAVVTAVVSGSVPAEHGGHLLAEKERPHFSARARSDQFVSGLDSAEPIGDFARPVSALGTNLIDGGLARTNMASPTNRVTVGPRA